MNKIVHPVKVGVFEKERPLLGIIKRETDVDIHLGGVRIDLPLADRSLGLHYDWFR